jgi:uroporphyrinogen III methyltransferase/synthase
VEDVFSHRVDWIMFTSSSTVKNFLALAGPHRLRNVKIASIGPVTSATAHMHGLDVAVEAQQHTMDGLIDAMRSAIHKTA